MNPGGMRLACCNVFSVFIQVNVEDSYVFERLSFLQSILGPYIEGYWTTALTITKLREREMAGKNGPALLLTLVLWYKTE